MGAGAAPESGLASGMGMAGVPALGAGMFPAANAANTDSPTKAGGCGGVGALGLRSSGFVCAVFGASFALRVGFFTGCFRSGATRATGGGTRVISVGCPSSTCLTGWDRRVDCFRPASPSATRWKNPRDSLAAGSGMAGTGTRIAACNCACAGKAVSARIPTPNTMASDARHSTKAQAYTFNEDFFIACIRHVPSHRLWRQRRSDGSGGP
jgi:hypothetical protein